MKGPSREVGVGPRDQYALVCPGQLLRAPEGWLLQCPVLGVGLLRGPSLRC